MRRLMRTLGVLFLLGLLALGWAGYEYSRFLDSPLRVPEGEQTLEFKRGESLRTLVRELHQRGLDDHHLVYWLALAQHRGVGRSLKAGEYRIESGMTPQELLRRISDGRVVMHRFTLIEGQTFRELRVALASHPVLVQASAGMSDAELMKSLGFGGQHPEGRFLPETYSFARGYSDMDLLRAAHAAMERELEQAFAQRAEGVRLTTPYEVLILASIIEKETGLASERSLISAVFNRRLALGMMLQTDPTVIYGLGEQFDGNLRRVDLQRDTPYNTYTRTGLPPTPIAMPGAAAIRAAVAPADSKALFFVSRGDGSHVFSDDYDAHRRAVDEFQRKRRAQ